MTNLHKALFTATLTLVGMMPFYASVAQAEKQLVDKVIAVVNDEIILKSELTEKVLKQAQMMAAQNLPVDDTNVLANKVLDTMVMEILQLERAKRIGLQVTDDEINAQLQEIASQNNITLFELRNRLNIEAPSGFLKARDSIEKQILIQKLREREVISQAYVTESEIQNFIKRQNLAESAMQVKLSHILIALPESASAEQRKVALNNITNIKTRLLQNEDFSQLAIRYSNGSNALQGGDLGWIEENQIPSFFVTEVEKLQVGQVSDVIESPSGFHLIKLEDKKDIATANNSKTEYHLHRFVILSDDAATSQKVPQAIAELAANMDSMQDFQALFTRFADIPKEINADSDLGWRTLERIPEVIQQDVAALSPKNALPPLLTEKGWMILYLDDVREISEVNESERQQAIQTIRMRKANEMFELWLRRLRDEAFIQVKPSN